jgi:hypothetical protein
VALRCRDGGVGGDRVRCLSDRKVAQYLSEFTIDPLVLKSV